MLSLISYLLLINRCSATFTVADIESIIQQESSWRAGVVSSEGAIGLMQVTPVVLQDYNKEHNTNYGIGHLYLADINVEVGLWHLCRWRGYSKKELVLIYWMGITRYREYVRGKVGYLRWGAIRHLQAVFREKLYVKK